MPKSINVTHVCPYCHAERKLIFWVGDAASKLWDCGSCGKLFIVQLEEVDTAGLAHISRSDERR